MQNFIQNLEQYLQKFIDHLPLYLLAVLVFMLFWVASRIEKVIVHIIVSKFKDKEKIEGILILERLGRSAVLILGGILALSLAGVNLTALMTGLGLVGFAVGFALKDMISNFLAGIIILIQRLFKIGDYIEIEKFSGKVISIEIRHTLLREDDGKIIIIPNSNLLSKILKRTPKDYEKYPKFRNY
ncbi:MAG: mechanosensitive ion channel domain-containing protein [Patescibacteria group bacterium]